MWVPIVGTQPVWETRNNPSTKGLPGRGLEVTHVHPHWVYMGQCWVWPLEAEATGAKVRDPSPGHTFASPSPAQGTCTSLCPFIVPATTSEPCSDSQPQSERES